MPNWCFNSASVSHENPEMIAKLIEAANKDELFNAFVPMPEELRNTSAPAEYNEQLNEKYGASDWYSWSVNNWGTKWECCDADAVAVDGKSASVSFNTAWSPPIPFYDALVEMGFSVDATFTEEGMGFAGHYVDGEEYSVDLNFDGGQEWVDSIEDDILRDIVQDQYDSWLEWQEEEKDEA